MYNITEISYGCTCICFSEREAERTRQKQNMMMGVIIEARANKINVISRCVHNNPCTHHCLTCVLKVIS